MRAVVVVTDSEAMPEFERAFLAGQQLGFTIVPAVLGRGRTGLKAGDRVHPGASSLLFTVVPDAELASTLAFLKEVRDRAGVTEGTKIWTVEVEEPG